MKRFTPKFILFLGIYFIIDLEPIIERSLPVTQLF